MKMLRGFANASKRSIGTGTATAYRVGFVGLGQMGLPMAQNLYKKLGDSCDSFRVFDTNPESVKAFCTAFPKAVPVESVKELAQHSNVIITMLPAAKHVRQVVSLMEPVMNPNSLLIDSSTIDPGTAQWLSGICKGKNSIGMDAPVSGGTPGAQAGTLTFMVGAESQKVFDQAHPILTCMGKNIVNCQGSGNGQIAKICNNMMLGISMIAASESLQLGQRLGMDPKLLSSIMNTSSGRCWSTDTYNPVPGVMPNVPSSRNYSGGFGNTLIAKDLGLAVEAAQSSKSTILLGSIAHQVYNHLSALPDYQKKDFSSVFQFLSKDKTAS